MVMLLLLGVSQAISKLRAAVESADTSVTCVDVDDRPCRYSRKDLLLFLTEAPPQWPRTVTIPAEGSRLLFENGWLRGKVYAVSASVRRDGSLGDIRFRFVRVLETVS